MATFNLTLDSPGVEFIPVQSRLGQTYVFNLVYGALAAADIVNLDFAPLLLGSVRAHAVKTGVASAGEILEVLNYSDSARTLPFPLASSPFVGVNASQPYLSASAASMNTGGWWTAPYGRLRYTNGASAQTALRLGVVLLPY